MNVNLVEWTTLISFNKNEDYIENKKIKGPYWLIATNIGPKSLLNIRFFLSYILDVGKCTNDTIMHSYSYTTNINSLARNIITY